MVGGGREGKGGSKSGSVYNGFELGTNARPVHETE